MNVLIFNPIFGTSIIFCKFSRCKALSSIFTFCGLVLAKFFKFNNLQAKFKKLGFGSITHFPILKIV